MGPRFLFEVKSKTGLPSSAFNEVELEADVSRSKVRLPIPAAPKQLGCYSYHGAEK